MQLIGATRRFWRSTSAVAAVEFAIIAPVIILMYFGLAELTQALICQRRISHTAATVGDLVSQSSSTTAAQVGDIFTVGGAIVAPYPTAPLEVRVTSITADANGNATVDWSRASGMAPLTKGQSVTVPAAALSANQSVIRSEVTYAYASPMDFILPNAITFTNTYYLHPRVSAQVTCADC